MQPRIELLKEKKLVGIRLTMSLANNKTGELWRSFMPRRSAITNNLTTDLISLQVYKPTHFTSFSPLNEFEKWALVEVANFDSVPEGMEPFTLTCGLYAVFDYKGSSTDTSYFNTSSEHGFPIQLLYSTTAPILRYWVRNTKTRTPIRKKKSGSRYVRNNKRQPLTQGYKIYLFDSVDIQFVRNVICIISAM